ncbi:MAG: hypothetical protein AAGA18_12135 [Verrucomicrobiota bacterium]
MKKNYALTNRSLIHVIAVLWVLYNTAANSAVFNIKDYGAVANDGLDDAAAFRAAVSAALSAGSGNVVKLDKGTWKMSSFDGNNVLNLQNKASLRIQGTPSTILLIENYHKRVFLINDCSNLTFKEMHITYKIVPIATGRVMDWTGSGENRQYTVKHQAGTLEFDDPFFSSMDAKTIFFTQNKVPRRVVPATFQVYSPRRIEKLSQGKWKLKLDRRSDAVMVDDYINYIGRSEVAGICRVNDSSNIKFFKIKISNIPGMGWVGKGNNKMDFDHCKAVLPKHVNICTTSDLIHLGNSKNTQIKNCYLTAAGDTIINLKANLPDVVKKESNTKIKITKAQFQGEVGDKIRIIRPSTGGTVVTRNIQGISYSGNYVILTIPSTTVSIVAGDEVFNEDWCHNHAIIKNNTIENARRQGLLIRALDAKIQYNTIKGMGGSGIQTVQKYSYNEGGCLENSLIRYNSIRDVELTSGAYGSISILFGTESSQLGDTVYEAIRNVRIDDNEIVSYHDRAVLLNGAFDCEITNNTLKSLAKFIFKENYIFEVRNSSQIDIIGNNAKKDNRKHTGRFKFRNAHDISELANRF